MVLLGAAIFFAMHLAFMRQLDATLEDEGHTLANQYQADGSGEFGEAIAEREAVQSPTRLLYAVFASDGRRIAGHLRQSDCAALLAGHEVGDLYLTAILIVDR